MGFTSRVCAVNFCLIFHSLLPGPLPSTSLSFYLISKLTRANTALVTPLSPPTPATWLLTLDFTPPSLMTRLFPPSSQMLPIFQGTIKALLFYEAFPFCFHWFFSPLPKRLSPVLLIKYRIYPTLYYWVLLKKKKYLFFIEGYLLYRILLFSVKPHHEPAIGIHISPPFWNSLPSLSPSHPSRWIQSPCLSFVSHTANSCSPSILHMVM